MFYTYYQNNSGGRFIINERVSDFVIIEACCLEQVNDRAIHWAGIYFNGCEKEIDCDCCGDRWYNCPDENKEPSIYGKPIEKYVNNFSLSDRQKYCIVYYEKDNGKPTIVWYKKRGKR